MDNVQAQVFSQMVEAVDRYLGSHESLADLVANLRLLFDGAGIGDARLSSEFESHWAPIDGELELRIWVWAQVKWASDERLHERIAAFRSWAAREATRPGLDSGAPPQSLV